MNPVSFLRASLLLVAAAPPGQTTALCSNGWFGPTCQYQCHCAGSALCNKHDGSCSSGCHQDWFGPACQYKSIGFSADSTTTKVDLLKDKNDTTCFDKKVTPFFLILDTPGPLKGIRAVVSRSELLRRFRVYYYTEETTKSKLCSGPKANKNKNIGDIFCNTADNVAKIILNYNGLCLLYLSGDCPPGTHGPACDKSCSVHCAGADHACSHMDGGCYGGCEPGYTGDTCDQKCDSGFYGERCYATCSGQCRGNQNLCDHVNGTCDLGCDPGYQDPLCTHECPTGFYGNECTQTCSDHCAGDQNSCHHVNGTCDLGCDPGYQGSSCTQACFRGKHGPGCNQTCSVQCSGPDNPCHHVDGSCYLGCTQDDQSPMCRSVLQQQVATGGCELNTWIITVTAVVAAVSMVIAAVLMWRLYKISKDRTSAPAYSDTTGGVEAASQENDHRKRSTQESRMGEITTNVYNEPNRTGIRRTVQQETAGMQRPNQHYEPMEMTGPENVHVYDTGFDHYDNPLDLMRAHGVYEIPQSKPVDPTSQNIAEREQGTPAISGTVMYENINH